MARVLVLDNYDSFVYNLVQYVGELGAEPVVHRSDALTLDQIGQLDPDAAPISPGPGRPQDAGLSNINLDLMYALPGQALAGALSDVEHAIALAPAHISHYQLTLEPNTRFAAQPPPLPDDDSAWAMQEACQARLAEAGYAQYEVSAYARDGRRCAHNLNYWRFGDYLGIGAGAHGKLTLGGRVVRTEKARSPRAYLEAGGRAGARRDVPAVELPFEFMLNALRLTGGFTLAEFEHATGLPATGIRPVLAALESRGLLGASGACLRPTELGFRFLNDLMAAFLPATPAARPAIRARSPVPAAG